MSSTDGSPTVTGWKRRSRAASFSTYLRYSSSVVAPMQRSSPRARAGFSRLAASLPPFGPAGADDRVQLVDEEDHVAGVGHFAEHGLQPLLELAAELRAGHQGAHVQGDHPLVLEAFGHVGIDDPQGEPFGDGRLAHARLADQHGVVFRPPREDLHDAADFLIAADHRIELSLPRPLDQVDAVAFQGLELAFRRLIGHAGAAADGLQHLEQVLVGDGVEFQDVLGLRVDLRRAPAAGVRSRRTRPSSRRLRAGRPSSTLVQFAADLRRRAARDVGEMAQFGLDDLVELSAIDADAFEDRPDDAVVFRQQRGQQVQRVDLRMAAIGGQFLCPRHGLLGLQGQFVETKCHSRTPVCRGVVSRGLRRLCPPTASTFAIPDSDRQGAIGHRECQLRLG